jgi:hypothetical protein
VSANRPRTRAAASMAGLVISIALALVVCPVRAQSHATTVEQLAFLTGNWTRTTDGMHVEQVFLPPEAGTIVGMQRRTEAGATLVSYFFIIEETDKGIVCRFKHFENDYTTYEDRNNTGPRTFWLLESSADAVTFEERTADGALYLRFRITDADQLGIAVGSPNDFESNTFTESLHDRIG